MTVTYVVPLARASGSRDFYDKGRSLSRGSKNKGHSQLFTYVKYIFFVFVDGSCPVQGVRCRFQE